MNETEEAKAVKAMTQALEILRSGMVKPTRENSIVITKLEEALMWCNKDRTNKGELKANPIHV